MNRFPFLAAGLVFALLGLSGAAFGQRATFLDSFGSPGAGDGQFNDPADVAVDPSGVVYVCDAANHRIQRFTVDGVFLSTIGSFGSGLGQFSTPAALWKIPGFSGDLFVSDFGNHRVWRIGDGEFPFFEAQFGAFGTGNGQFRSPLGICHSAFNDEVYVVDSTNARVQRFTTSGVYLGQWGSAGAATGQFQSPDGIAVDPRNGAVYVTEPSGHRIQRFSATGVFQAIWGAVGSAPGQFMSPQRVKVGGDGFVYVCDLGNHRVQVFTAEGRFLHSIGTSGSGAGQVSAPYGIGLGSGLLYVAEFGNDRVSRFRLTDEAPVVTIKGPKRINVTRANHVIRGSASDDLAVDLVEVQVGKKPFRAVFGTSAWKFSVRKLPRGKTRVQVRATDLGGASAKVQSITLTRR